MPCLINPDTPRTCERFISWFAVGETEAQGESITCPTVHSWNASKLKFKPWLHNTHSCHSPHPVRKFGRLPPHSETQPTVLGHDDTQLELASLQLSCSQTSCVPYERPSDVTSSGPRSQQHLPRSWSQDKGSRNIAHRASLQSNPPRKAVARITPVTARFSSRAKAQAF